MGSNGSSDRSSLHVRSDLEYEHRPMQNARPIRSDLLPSIVIDDSNDSSSSHGTHRSPAYQQRLERSFPLHSLGHSMLFRRARRWKNKSLNFSTSTMTAERLHRNEEKELIPTSKRRSTLLFIRVKEKQRYKTSVINIRERENGDHSKSLKNLISDRSSTSSFVVLLFIGNATGLTELYRSLS